MILILFFVFCIIRKKKEEQKMHMADALLSPAVAGTMYVCSSVAAGYSVKKIRQE